MTPQEIAQRIWTRYNDNKGQCTSEDGFSCLYRNEEDTNSCFAGELLPEGHPVRNPKVMGDIFSIINEFELPDFISHNSDLISDFQNLHDHDKSWDKLKPSLYGINQFKHICSKHNIKLETLTLTPPLEQ